MSNATDQKPVRATRVRKWVKRGLMALIFLLVLLVFLEIYARLVLGLGDPPLMVADDTMEYRPKPGEYMRFGNRVYYNKYSMRSDDVSKSKMDPTEFRVLVLGDSVIHGGSLTDQSDIVTERLETILSQKLGSSVWVGNVSANSWGPPNLLAYILRYGWFDADVAIVVLNSGDAEDAATFEPVVGVDPDFPGKRPLFALEEAFLRYLPRYLPTVKKDDTDEQEQEVRLSEELPKVRQSLGSLRKLFAAANEVNIPIVVVQYPNRNEASGEWKAGHELIARVAHEAGVPTLDARPYLRSAIEDGANPYRDNIHPNAIGQERLAVALEDVVLDLLSTRQAGSEKLVTPARP